MKKLFDIPVLLATVVFVMAAFFVMCVKPYKEEMPEEIPTARVAAAGKCFSVCYLDNNPDLRLITNASQNPPLVDGIIDSSTYFWTTYHVRTHPIRLTQNYLTTGRDAIRYGWDSGVIVNRVQLQCLVENIAAYSCENDWVFNESQGTYNSTLGSYMFNDLFQFETQERGNGNNWKLISTHFKKEFFPSIDKVIEYQSANYCYYYGNGDRAIQSQTGDFYYNWFMFPNHDGVYKLIIKFNPLIRGCRVAKETNYLNNEKTFIIEIKQGRVIYSKA